ncbi:disulfide bond formation protein B [Novosphingobium sp. 1949]|uniref:Disulfide bond formation protein B n=1 Tax=Novosphingobium organovorum TaxID=2930092 RepID=A0ABT0BIN7_9SPHN|nr:disulfide bond formation protein B [Novosphingobium organovorum]MCJ2184823.1 disulfide bond formation protein B [Novosphingobium organovorum]
MIANLPTSLRAARLLALLVPLAALGGAYLGQYGFGLAPCEMCWWQRYPHFFALAIAALSFVRAPVRPLVAIAALGILASGLIGGYHAGVELGWWKGLTECTAMVSGSADPLAAIMKAPLVRCDVVQFAFLGISMAGWNFIASTLSGLAILGLVGSSRKAK